MGVFQGKWVQLGDCLNLFGDGAGVGVVTPSRLKPSDTDESLEGL